MKQYFTKRQVNKILSKNTDGVSTSLSSERLSYDKFPSLRSKESIKKYLYEVAPNEIKRELSNDGRFSLKDEEIDWCGLIWVPHFFIMIY